MKNFILKNRILFIVLINNILLVSLFVWLIAGVMLYAIPIIALNVMFDIVLIGDRIRYKIKNKKQHICDMNIFVDMCITCTATLLFFAVYCLIISFTGGTLGRYFIFVVCLPIVAVVFGIILLVNFIIKRKTT